MPPFRVAPQSVITFDPAREDALLDLNAVAALPDGGAITTQMNELLHVFNAEGVKVRTLGQLNYRSERMQAACARWHAVLVQPVCVGAAQQLRQDARAQRTVSRRVQCAEPPSLLHKHR